ncbi:WcbI family polysaccharide biosynthesis putative acetyltransferase [Nocardioides aurantiacus]|uniref:WcbI family polysaccharide biosynthesis putative acetyltransferase n=1 Tax=Nocardioides aurantiacus TaxID=86796 RepID=UPI00403FA161
MTTTRPAVDPPLARRSRDEKEHYRDLLAGPGDERLPVLLVTGNCQAESLRLLLEADDVRAVRVPPLHDVRPHEVEPLRRWLARTDLLVAQPVRGDYRGLPIGTEQQVAALPPGATVALVPIIRYAGLHPWHLVMHPPGLVDPEPPVVAYHDVRLVARAAWARSGRPAPPDAEPAPGAVLAVAAASVAELARREAAAGAVVVSDLLARPRADTVRTLNHPGNRLLEPVAARLRAALGLDVRPPGVDRPLLTSVVAPLEAAVVAAHGLPDPPRPDWRVGGRDVGAAEVAAAQLAWYAARPDVLDLALDRSAGVRATLGVLAPGD